MNVLRVVMFCFFALLASSVVCANSAPQKDALVVFSATTGSKAFTISCAPRTKEIGKSVEWIERCNDLGRSALDAAAKSGLIASVSGTAFGMASQFIQKLPPSASVAESTMSRDFPLVATGI